MDLAERMRDLREEAGLTKTALARPRYTVSYVSQIESGRRKPSQQALDFFAARLGVTSRYLATGVPEDLEVSLRYALEAAILADLHSGLLSIYFERGDVLRAERAARRALNAAEQGTPPYVRATTYWHASRVLAESKRWDEALDYATRARFLMEQIEDRRRVGRLHNAYAFICLEADPPRTEEAAIHLRRAQDLLEDGSATPGDLAYVFTERARLALLEGRTGEAVVYADRALEHADETLEIARCLFLKGRALASLGKRGQSHEALRR